MITKNDIFEFLKNCGVKNDDKLTLHCSLRSIGKIENGADGFIDAFSEYLSDGLFIVPTHTWNSVCRSNPFYDVRSTMPCIGTLCKGGSLPHGRCPLPAANAFGDGIWQKCSGMGRRRGAFSLSCTCRRLSEQTIRRIGKGTADRCRS